MPRPTRSAAADFVELRPSWAPATRNRYIACLRAVMIKAAGPWEWIVRCPKFKTYREPTQRIRWLTEDEARQLIDALPDWVAQMARFALATGLRQSNVFRLEWRQIHLKRRVAWIEADQAKAGEAIGVPLYSGSMEVLERQRGKHPTRVFLDNTGQPMDFWPFWARRHFDVACKKVRITNFRRHDLRHTWESWHVQKGTPYTTCSRWAAGKPLKSSGSTPISHRSTYWMEHVERVCLKSTTQIRHTHGPGKARK